MGANDGIMWARSVVEEAAAAAAMTMDSSGASGGGAVAYTYDVGGRGGGGVYDRSGVVGLVTNIHLSDLSIEARQPRTLTNNVFCFVRV